MISIRFGGHFEEDASAVVSISRYTEGAYLEQSSAFN
jgi:hypothetical protein